MVLAAVGPGADLDRLQDVDGIIKTIYTLSREGHGRKGEWAEMPAVPRVCLGWHTADVTFLSHV